MTLELRPVRGTADIEWMRLVRNVCRTYMTRSIAEITPAQQATWWRRLTADDPHFETWKPNLLRDGLTVIGYGIAWHGERVASKRWPESRDAWWVTGGLLPQDRSHGHGRFLFEHLIAIAGLPCWLEVRADNVRARALYAKLGFVTVGLEDQVAGVGGGVITMKRVKP